MVQDEGGQAPPGPHRPVLTRCLSQQPARASVLGVVNSMPAAKHGPLPERPSI